MKLPKGHCEVTAKIRKRSVAFSSGGNCFAVSAVKGNMMKLSDVKRDVEDISN